MLAHVRAGPGRMANLRRPRSSWLRRVGVFSALTLACAHLLTLVAGCGQFPVVADLRADNAAAPITLVQHLPPPDPIPTQVASGDEQPPKESTPDKGDSADKDEPKEKPNGKSNGDEKPKGPRTVPQAICHYLRVLCHPELAKP